MTSRIQNNNNVEPDLKNEKRYSPDTASITRLSHVKKNKKKKKLSLFSFRSKRTKVVTSSNSAVTSEQSDSVSVCSEISTADDSGGTFEVNWTETEVGIFESTTNQSAENSSVQTSEGALMNEAVGKSDDILKSNTEVDNAVSDVTSCAVANEEESSITIVTPLSDDDDSVAVAAKFEQSSELESSNEQKSEEKKESVTIESKKKSQENDKTKGTQSDLLGLPDRPNSIHLKNGSLNRRVGEALLSQKDSIKKKQRQLFADQPSSSTDCSSYPVSPVRKLKSKKAKMSSNAPPTHQLTVRLLSGENLAARDSNGLSDPYVKFKMGRRTLYKSRICKATLNPRWGEEFTVPVKKEDEISVRVFDRDLGMRDDFMGSHLVELQDLAEGEEVELSLALEDQAAGEEDLGSIHIALILVPISDDTDSFINMVEPRSTPEDFGDTISISSSRFPERYSFSRSDSNASDISRRTGMSLMMEPRNRKSIKTNISTATVQLVSGTGLPARDSNGLSDPYVKLHLGKQRHRSKVCYKTLEPVWKEEFIFQLTGRESLDRETAMLDITVWDKDSYRKDDFIGRCELDLWSLENDKTQSFTMNLVDAPGSIMLLVTRHSCVPVYSQPTNSELSQLREKFSIWSTFSELSDIGLAEIKIIRANGCRAADIGGKSDPFCVVELCNQRAQTHTCYKTLDPVWNKTITFPIKDIHDVLKLTIYDEDKDGENDFLGKISIPLLRARNGDEKVYALKDRKLLNRTKGTITVQISLIYNPARAAIRTFSPREQKFMEQDARFKRQLLLKNFHRVWNCIQAFLQTLEFINSCFTWENPARSATAFIVYLLLIWNVELYMIPILLLLLLMKNYFAVVIKKTKVDRRMVDNPDEIFNDDDEDDVEDSSNRLSLIQRLNAIQEVLLKVQNILDWIACLLERIHNTFTWTVPFLSTLAVIVLSIVCLILYFISFRTIAILWGINKFTKRLRKPNYIPNNELLDFLSRIPSEVELDEYQELSLMQGSPKTAKKKK